MCISTVRRCLLISGGVPHLVHFFLLNAHVEFDFCSADSDGRSEGPDTSTSTVDSDAPLTCRSAADRTWNCDATAP